MNTNKRKYRELDPETKQKISQAMKGKSKSFTQNPIGRISLISRQQTENDEVGSYTSLPFITTCQGDKTCQSARKIKAYHKYINDSF